MRATATPRAIAIQTRAMWRTNVNFVLPSIQVPTLVLHRTEYRHEPMISVCQLTDRIPDGRFVEVPGSDVMPQTEESDLILGIMQEFLTGSPPSPTADRFLTTCCSRTSWIPRDVPMQWVTERGPDSSTCMTRWFVRS